ncbi:arsenate reductase family protein [Fictibacillus iocasae]|uniref:Arsenate reductase family protein n=1 Tax=Fictibacillus iocasae TaxID=2715437 RepID=A0ABW2NNP5_9BACL
MTITFYEYPKCSTCQKAKKWLKEQDIIFEAVHIVENPPEKKELKRAAELSGLDLKKLFNTSGMKYRELGLKDKLKTASEEEMLEWLASDGMLVKRPLAIDTNAATAGFKEDTYEKTWK